MKLYIITDALLYAGLKAAQAVHAAILFGEEYPHLKNDWYTNSNNVVILEHYEPETIAQRMESAGFKVSRFFEPDMKGQLTAIAIEPNDGRLLSTLPLAGSREQQLLLAALSKAA